MTIGIMDAFHYKNEAADLAFFNKEMGLVPLDGQNGDPCFKDVDQNGTTQPTTSAVLIPVGN